MERARHVPTMWKAVDNKARVAASCRKELNLAGDSRPASGDAASVGSQADLMLDDVHLEIVADNPEGTGHVAGEAETIG